MSIFNTLLIIVLIILLIWGISLWFFRTNIIYDKLCVASTVSKTDDSDTNVIINDIINDNNSSNFMLSVWFYIDNWGNSISEEKNILYMASKSSAITPTELQGSLTGVSKSNEINNADNNYKNLSIGLDKYENNLFIDIETYNDSPNDSDSSTFTRYIIKNVSVQKWNCITLSIDTKTLDVYLDGKLRNSFILNGLYRNIQNDKSKKNIYLGNMGTPNTGFEGFITRVRFEANSIDPQESFSIYKQGVDSSVMKSGPFNKYGLKVSFMEYDKDIGSFTI